MTTLAPSFLNWVFFVLAGNEVSHIISVEFEIRPNPAMDCGGDYTSAFIFEWIFFILAGYEDNYNKLG